MDQENTRNIEVDKDQGRNKESAAAIIQFTMKEVTRIRAPWKRAIIIKLMSYKLTLNYLERKLKKLWKIQGGLGQMGNRRVTTLEAAEEQVKQGSESIEQNKESRLGKDNGAGIDNVYEGKSMFLNSDRGIAIPEFLPSERDYIRRFQPKIIILMETHVKKVKAETILGRLNYTSNRYVPPNGHVEGINMIWDAQNLDVQSLENIARSICVTVRDGDEDRRAFISAIY
ncbi:hypothetical protein ACH5RR_026013 [Cinchona calisaya]|uniref:Uncharacterized protein n=1 Tax=Cinchona calisaya TaxID=153742 RepID=A0ABD2Z389_9GENT